MKRYYDVKQCSSMEDLEKMGMSRATVYRKAKQLGRPSKYSGKTEEQIIEIMKAEGKSSKVIATQLRRIKMSK